MVDTSREAVKAVIEEGLHHASTFGERVAVRKVIAALLSERDAERAAKGKAEAERDALRVAAVHSQDSHSITVFERDQARAENARLQARIEAAEKVIGPFANAAAGAGTAHSDDSMPLHVSAVMRLGQLRAARAWLEEKV